MPENVVESYRHARRIARVGAVCLYAMTGLLTLIMVVVVIATLRGGPSQWLSVLGLVARNTAAIVATVLLAEFLRNFRNEGSPFGRRQSLRLSAAGALLFAHTISDSLFGTAAYDVALVDGPVPISVGSWSGLDPMVVSLAVFLFCLGMVVRYSKALKDDSDSIV